MANEAQAVPSTGAVPYDPNGFPVAQREAIASTGTSVAAGETDTTIMTAPSAGFVPFVQKIKGVCRVAPGADVVATVEDRDGAGATKILDIDLFSSHAEGSVVEFDLVTPFQGQAAEAIVITQPANSGTWRWYVSGYLLPEASFTSA